MNLQNSDKPNKEKLLEFLYNIAMETDDGSLPENSPISVIMNFVNTDISCEIASKVIPNIKCDFDFHSYFKDIESLKELIELKETDPEGYYKIVHYESILLNIISTAVNCPYIIVLNPDNLYKSYYLQLRFK